MTQSKKYCGQVRIFKKAIMASSKVPSQCSQDPKWATCPHLPPPTQIYSVISTSTKCKDGEDCIMQSLHHMLLR